MGGLNWPAIGLCTLLGAGLWRLRAGRMSLAEALLTLLLSALPALLLGHALARIGPAALALKPKLYWMQSGGLAGFFVIPAVLLTARRDGKPWRAALIEAGTWLGLYLLMGTVFWALG